MTLARMIRLFGRPVAEARPEAVRHGANLEFPGKSPQSLVENRPPVLEGEHQRAAVSERPGIRCDGQPKGTAPLFLHTLRS